MGMVIRALCIAEFAIPVKAVLNNLGENPPKDISIWGVTKVQWSDGTVTDGVKHCGCAYYIEGAEKRSSSTRAWGILEGSGASKSTG